MANVYIYSTRIKENNSSAQFNVQFPFHLGDQINGYLKSGAKFRWLRRSNNQNQIGENGLNYGNVGSPNNILLAIDRAHPEFGIDSLVSQYGGLTITPFLTGHTRSNFLGGEYPIGFHLKSNHDEPNNRCFKNNNG